MKHLLVTTVNVIAVVEIDDEAETAHVIGSPQVNGLSAFPDRASAEQGLRPAPVIARTAVVVALCVAADLAVRDTPQVNAGAGATQREGKA